MRSTRSVRSIRVDTLVMRSFANCPTAYSARQGPPRNSGRVKMCFEGIPHQRLCSPNAIQCRSFFSPSPIFVLWLASAASPNVHSWGQSRCGSRNGGCACSISWHDSENRHSLSHQLKLLDLGPLNKAGYLRYSRFVNCVKRNQEGASEEARKQKFHPVIISLVL